MEYRLTSFILLNTLRDEGNHQVMPPIVMCVLWISAKPYQQIYMKLCTVIAITQV